MKKASSKSKAAQGCMKISSFFAKVDCKKSPAKPKIAPVISKDIIDIESEDEESESLLSYKPRSGQKKRKFQDQVPGLSPPVKKGTKADPEESPQPSTSGVTHCNKTGHIQISEVSSITPSTCGGTPLKSKPIISVKTPEKLLSPAALRELYSPSSTKRSRKESSPINPKSSTKVKKIDFEQKTPEKQKYTKSPTKSSTKKSSGNKSIPSESSPSKSKRTPKKLFERSPSNLSEFNVEVLRSFVRITPSKKEVDPNEEREGRKRSLEVQLQNEKTPVKDLIPSILPGTSYSSPLSKVRAKLDFTNCTASSVSVKNKTCSESSDKIQEELAAKISDKENHDTNNLSFSFEEDCWETDFFDQMDYSLDLTSSQHCKIVSVNQGSRETIITVKSTHTNEQALCMLQGFWMHSKLCIGDTVHLMATKSGDNWLINNDSGFLVFEPDLLISTTSVVNSVFCKRRSILQERFRGFDTTNKYMIVGSMVHCLLQDVLRNKLFQYKDIEKCALEILNRKEWIRQIYESGEPLTFITEEFLNYISKVHEFVKTYVENGTKKMNPKSSFNKDDWKGTISGIEDIEENIWCPDLGVKGKVDVSIRNGLSMMPLELKTGRASVSLEHRGQVLLYIMMMNKLGYQVSSGLLLYLKEGILREIPPSAAEKRDIILLRNEFAYFLSRIPKVVETSKGKFLEPVEVPEPIDHPCCSKCPYNGICMAYSKYSNEDISRKKSLKQVHNQLSNFLTTAHIDYFMHWTSLLSIEMPERNGTKALRDIYTLPPEERKKKGKCLIDLVVAKVIEEFSGTCVTTFEQTQQNQTNNFLLSGFAENTYVVVSVKSRPAIATGFITDISMGTVTVSLDRNLNKKYKNETFFLDSYDSAVFLTYNLASLALILDTSDHSNKLRSIIVDRQPATFQPKLPKILAEKARPILKRLNKVQQRAVLKAIAANEYFLIKGMPGTGKTATIVALIQLLIEMKKTVLITSHTHSAVDNVCLKLIKFGVKFMRLGSEAKMDPSLREYSEQNLTKDCGTPDALEAAYNRVQVLAVTCLGSGNAILSKRTMDVCIVDESTQVLQCSVFRPLYAANTFILIGDPDQLPAVVRNKTAIELGMSESLFERLDSDESCISLNLNYRMNESITALANALTYKGELQIGAERVAKATVNVPRFSHVEKMYASQTWLVKALDRKLENAVQFIDTGPVWNVPNTVTWGQSELGSDEFQAQEVQHCVNIFEAAVIYRLVQALVTEGGVPSEQIGVIATYRIQVALLARLLKSTNVDVNTVDQFQGKDKSIIIYSCSKSKDLSKEWIDNKFDLTEDKRRLNVAITRAKHKLIIVGDLATLQKYSTFKKIKNNLEKNVIRLRDCDGFKWDSALDLDL